MRGAVMLSCSMFVATACQEQPDPPPPPVGGGPTSGATVPPVGGNDSADGSSTMASQTGATGDPTMGTGATSSTGDASGTGPDVPLLTGQLLEGPRNIIPDSCQVRLHTLDSFDPGSGIPTDIAFQTTVVVEGLPQPYIIDSVPDGAVGAGDLVYVSALCDIDGDGDDDDLGGYYPLIPAEPVLLPATGINLVLEFVP